MLKAEISILFATCDRYDILCSTLDSFTRLSKDDLRYEIIVVDNACDQLIQELVGTYAKVLNIHYLKEEQRGKNFALNAGLAIASGDTIVLTDDDVVVDKEWLKEIIAGMERWPDYDLFGGAIEPLLPMGTVDSLGLLSKETSFFKSAYVITDQHLPEGPIEVGKIWGPNMAVRRRVFESGITFDPDLGPKGKSYIMGGETDFLHRASNLGFKGVFLPYAIVKHQIRKEQLTMKWLSLRAANKGRQKARHKPPVSRFMLFNTPVYLYKKFLECYIMYMASKSLNRPQSIEKMISFYVTYGQLVQSICNSRNKGSSD